MKLARFLMPVAVAAVLGSAAPTAFAATAVQASGTAQTTSFVATPVSSNGKIAVLHVVATSVVSGTLAGTSTTDVTCTEVIATGEAVCRGPEHFAGSVAGHPGTLDLLDVFTINFNTGATHGASPITGGTVQARGEIHFSGNAFAPLPYSGDIVLL